MAEALNGFGMGWLRDRPDFRDLVPRAPEVSDMLGKTAASGMQADALPASIDLRQWCSPVEDQGSIGSCTANAGVGLVEYFERKAFGTHIEASRLFLYKVTRDRAWKRSGLNGSCVLGDLSKKVVIWTPFPL